MGLVSNSEWLDKFRLALAKAGLIYAIFICGFASACAAIEHMIFVEKQILRPDFVFSESVEAFDHFYLLLLFLAVTICLVGFKLIVEYGRTLLFQVLSLGLLVVPLYIIAAIPKPGSLPGQTLRNSTYALYIVGWLDFLFFCLLTALLILQVVAIRKARSRHP